MDASKENGVSDSRAVYTPPVVVRINEMKQGAGRCVTTGSGDTEICGTGQSASGAGRNCGTGNSAIGGCGGNGNSATGTCDAQGSSGK